MARLRSEFSARFSGAPSLFRAPGRVNLIGEHTDYNDGFVMPAAIRFATCVAAAPNDTAEFRCASLQQDKPAGFSLNDPSPKPRHDWTDYIRGVQLQLAQAGVLTPAADLLIDSTVPMGAGLSSSAALEVSTALALLHLAGANLDREAIARLCQRAENEFVGSRSGIMDQFASLFGRRDHAVLLDCRSLETRYIPVPAGVKLVICNTMVKHSLASGEYNARRAECEACVQYFSQFRSGVTALRDVTEKDFQQHQAGLPEVLRRRCRHVITENARVLQAARALDSGDLAEFGRLMYESHASLRDDYEVSCRELDVMVELTRHIPGTFGARMTGGGFGGCIVALVEEQKTEDFERQISIGYSQATQINPEIYITEASEGATSLD